jgi:hypothetical protein
MHTNPSVLFGIIGLLLLCLVLLFIRWRQAVKALEAQRVGFTDLLYKTTIKLSAALEANESFERSREDIWKIYRQSSIGAGNAQAWLFRELQNAYFKINQYRKKDGLAEVPVPADLESAVIAFRNEHVRERDKDTLKPLTPSEEDPK